MKSGDKSEKSEDKAKKKPEEKKPKAIEFQVPLLLLRTDRGLKLLDKLGSLRVTSFIGWFHLLLLPFISVIGVSMLVLGVVNVLSQPVVRENVRSIGPLGNLLIPGLNPFLPITFGLAGLFVALVVHEVGHGVLARSLRIKVKSMGLLLLVILPIGAFVELDDKKMAKTSLRNAGRILAAGPGNNVIVGILSLLALFLIISSLAPVTMERGVAISGLVDGFPAESLGILPGDIVVAIDGERTLSPVDLSTVMSKYSTGDIIDLTYARGDELTTKQVELAPASNNSSRGIIGIFLTRDPIQTLEIFKEPNVRTLGLYFLPPTLVLPSIGSTSIVPYSEDMSIFYTSTLGSAYIPLANLFFWIWFININVAIFNAIPIYPLDGGQAFKKLLLSVGKVEEKMASRITLVVTLTMVSLVALFISLPYILPLL